MFQRQQKRVSINFSSAANSLSQSRQSFYYWWWWYICLLLVFLVLRFLQVHVENWVLCGSPSIFQTEFSGSLETYLNQIYAGVMSFRKPQLETDNGSDYKTDSVCEAPLFLKA